MTNPNNRAGVEIYDALDRYHVPSRTKHQPPYLCELGAHEGNGVCQCKHFTIRLEPLILRGITPEMAYDAGLAEIPQWGTVEDCLRCIHIHLARLKCADDLINDLRTRTHEKNDQAPSAA